LWHHAFEFDLFNNWFKLQNYGFHSVIPWQKYEKGEKLIAADILLLLKKEGCSPSKNSSGSGFGKPNLFLAPLVPTCFSLEAVVDSNLPDLQTMLLILVILIRTL
jgi:hypothetical protein